MELLKSHISFVHQIEGAGFDRDLIHHLGIVDLSGVSRTKGGNRAPQVHQLMNLQCSLPVVELSPGAQLQTELDSGTIERIDHLFKTDPQLFILVERGGFLHQGHRKALIDTPVLLVGLRKRGPGHHLDARSVEVSAQVKCSLNVSQTCSVGELGDAHHHKLVTAIEIDSVPVTLVAVDTLSELVFVEERYDLSEDSFSLVHGLRAAAYFRTAKLTKF